MPRTGGVYVPPSGTKGVANTTILSAPYNAFVDDLTADANAARPVTAGGTGATTASGARTALGLGTAATQNTGTSGATVPLLSGANTWSAQQTISSTSPALLLDESDTTTSARAFITGGDFYVQVGAAGSGAAGSGNIRFSGWNNANVAALTVRFGGAVCDIFHSGLTVPVVNGGTGGTTAAAARANIGADNASNLTTGTLPNARFSGAYSGATFSTTDIEVTGSTWSTTVAQTAGFKISGAAPNIQFRDTSGTLGAMAGVNSDQFYIYRSEVDGILSGVVFQVPLTGAGSMLFNGATVWTAANDGPSSGLDSDLLDGQDGTYYRNISNMNAGTLANARFGGAYDGVTNFSMTGTLKISSAAPVIQLIDTTSGSYSARMRVDANNVYFDSSTDDVSFGEVFRFELDTKIGYVASSRIWTEALAATRSIVAGNGLTGGGTLGASRTVTLGTPADITNSSASVVTATGHGHALGFVAAEVYTGSAVNNTAFPLGHEVLALGIADRNAASSVYLHASITSAYTLSSSGAELSGTWRGRGQANSITKMQRTA